MSEFTLIYTAKVWITSIVLAPIFSLYALIAKANTLLELGEMLLMLLGTPLMALLIGFYTIPGVLLFYFSTRILVTMKVNTLLMKIILSVMIMVIVTATGSIIGDFKLKLDWLLVILPYYLASLIGVWFTKLRTNFKTPADWNS